MGALESEIDTFAVSACWKSGAPDRSSSYSFAASC